MNAPQQLDAADRRVVILGGTGSVGEGIVRAWLSAGAEVVVPTRSASSADRFRTLIGENDRLHLVVGEYTGFDTAAEMASRIEAERGPVTDVIASIGGWWQAAPAWEVTEEVWQKFFVELTTAHFGNVRAWVPRIPVEGSYQLVLGGSAYTPVHGASIISMEQAALLMMHRVLMAEAGAQRRVFAMTLGPVITRGRGNAIDPSWVSNTDVGRVSVAQALSQAASEHIDMHSGAEADARLRELGFTGAER